MLDTIRGLFLKIKMKGSIHADIAAYILHRSGRVMSHPHSDLATNTIAIASIIIPFWLPGIAQISADAAIALPILGALWLILQIALKIHAFYKGRNH